MDKADFLKNKKTKNKDILPKTKKVGRPAKDEENKETETVILKITKAEMQAIKNKAGPFPLSTWFKNEIRVKTDIFKE